MNVFPVASPAKILAAMSAIGAVNIGTAQQTLLQQILVASATNGGGGGIPADAYTTPDGLDYYVTPDGLDYYRTP